MEILISSKPIEYIFYTEKTTQWCQGGRNYKVKDPHKLFFNALKKEGLKQGLKVV